MELYYSPLSCSLATRISLYEAGATAEYTAVDLKSKRTAKGRNFFEVTPMGQVPTLITDDGVTLTENTAVLQYVADRVGQGKLAPASAAARTRMQQWLGFIGTELHKAVFVPLLDEKAPDSVKAYSREKVAVRMNVLQQHLATHEYLLDSFSIADAYLTTVLNWAAHVQVDLKQWPAVAAYYQRMIQRPSIAKAATEELAMYKEEMARNAAAA